MTLLENMTPLERDWEAKKMGYLKNPYGLRC